MTFERATEIIKSKGVIDVECEGEPIWIKNVDKENMKAEVETIHDEKAKVVKLDDLYEVKEEGTDDFSSKID